MSMSHNRAVVKEYIEAREEGNDVLADRIWKANPDLQDQMTMARLKVKKWC